MADLKEEYKREVERRLRWCPWKIPGEVLGDVAREMIGRVEEAYNEEWRARISNERTART